MKASHVLLFSLLGASTGWFFGCVGDAPVVSLPDAAKPAEGGVDAGVRCNISTPFPANGVHLVSVSTPLDDLSPQLTPDELTLYFEIYAADGGAKVNIQVATRGNVTAPFGGAIPFAAANSVGDYVRQPCPSADGLTFYFSARLPNERQHLWAMSRSTVAAPFAGASLIPALNSTSDDVSPFVAADDTEIWFASGRSSSSTSFSSIFHATRQGQTFQTPTKVSELETSSSSQITPVLSADRLTIYFGRSDAKQSDIYVAQRATVQDPFSTPVAVTELNTPDNDAPGWLSRDQCRLYFSSNRPSGAGGLDIWVAERAP